MKKKLITIFSIILVATLLVAIVIFSSKKEKPEQKIPYPTGIHTDEIYWTGKECLIYQQNQKVLRYCTDNTTSEILSLKQRYTEFINRSIKLGEGYICDTYNFEITSPEQTATKIIVYHGKSFKDEKTLETNLTLKIDKCQKELLLSNAFSFLEESQYRWRINEETPQKTTYTIDTLNIESEGEQTKIKENSSTLISFETVAEFTQALANSNSTKFALIDIAGELWIIEK